jgi:hypothetical protein
MRGFVIMDEPTAVARRGGCRAPGKRLSPSFPPAVLPSSTSRTGSTRCSGWAGRITVLRDGKRVNHSQTPRLFTEPELVRLMVGRDIGAARLFVPVPDDVEERLRIEKLFGS